MKILNILYLLLFLTVFSCREELVDVPVYGTISGKVIEKTAGKPIKGVRISTAPTTSTVYTDADGNFTISQVPIADYSLKAELSGYVTNFHPVNLATEGQTVNVTIEMATDNYGNQPPAAPQLLLPADLSVDLPNSVNFTWNASDPENDSLKFDLVLKNSVNNNVQTFSALTAKSHTVDNLIYGATYFWQVIADDGLNPKVYSAVFQFKVVNVPTNRFLYTRKQNGNYYIVSSDENGNNLFNVTGSSQVSFRPRFNNVANKIAFIKNVGGNNQIFVSNKDGSNSTQITTVPISGFKNEEMDFSWNSNGSQLIYPNFDKLYRVNSDGTGLSLLYQTADGSLITECDWSTDGTKIALKTNNTNGYNAKIFVIDMQGTVTNTVLSNVQGGAGGLNFSIQGHQLLYTHDVSGFQNNQNYRLLDSRVFVYHFASSTATDLSAASLKPGGMNDLDPRFSPNDSEIILMSTSNDNISQRNIVRISQSTSGTYSRTTMFTNAEMPDWE